MSSVVNSLDITAAKPVHVAYWFGSLRIGSDPFLHIISPVIQRKYCKLQFHYLLRIAKYIYDEYHKDK